VFNDRVVFLPPGDHATLPDVAQSVRGFGVRRHGGPVAIDVTMRDAPARFRAAHSMPAQIKNEDEPVTAPGFAVSPGTTLTSPDRLSRLST
jgi:hypothetical protein